MRLARVGFANCRSIGASPVVLDLRKRINLLIGANNSGKSNVLEKLRRLKNERPHQIALKELATIMITSIHTLIYCEDAKATQAFLRDVLGWKYVAEDWDDDWLIFKSGRARWVCTRRTACGKVRLMITRGSTRSRSCAMTLM